MRHRTRHALAGAILCALLPCAALAQPVAVEEAGNAPVLLAAGSLRQALTEMLDAYRASGGARFEVRYGPSGKLREEIEGGRRADVFASASDTHTRALAQAGLLGASSVFAHNDLCVVSTPAAGIGAANLLEALARPALRLATSTPVSDPMGDYTWQFFRHADLRHGGLYAVLDAKALKLSGAGSPAPDGASPYIAAFRENKADAYIMYCTNAVPTVQALPDLKVLRIPDDLNVRSAYGIGARTGSQQGARLVAFVLGAQGQGILRKYGFH